MDVAAGLAALVIATVLWAGAIAKLARPDVIRLTLISLGVPVRGSWPAVSLLIAAEAAGALLILLAPGSPVSLAFVVTLFAVFALAGVAGLRARTPVACACFGSGDKPLGWRQVAHLPVAVALAFVAAGGGWTAQDGLALTVAALAGVGAWWTVQAWPGWQTTRHMRLSLREAAIASNELDLREEAHG